MTQFEKAMNKEDLLAYKAYDNTQYSLIPGISNKKGFMDPTVHKQKAVPLEEQQKRLGQFGYGRE